jgi:hypothetical protein
MIARNAIAGQKGGEEMVDGSGEETEPEEE